MIQTIISYIIWIQIGVWLFHAWTGLEDWRNVGIYDSQTLYLLFLGLGTFFVQKRLTAIPIDRRSLSLIFQHGFLLGMISWFFYQSWWRTWENFFVEYITFMLIFMILSLIVESQFHKFPGGWNWWIPPFFWRLGTLISLINTVTVPVIFIVLHESLSTVWVYFGFSWVFLWKESPSDSTKSVPLKI